jgi:hypothetical protein
MWVNKLIPFAVSNWRELLIGTLSAIIYVLLDKVAIANLERDKCTVKLGAQNAAVVQNAVDVVEREKIVMKYVDKVRVEHRDRVKVIYELGDKNETVKQAMANLNNYPY